MNLLTPQRVECTNRREQAQCSAVGCRRSSAVPPSRDLLVLARVMREAAVLADDAPGEEEQWMEMQRVECFERPTGIEEEPWKSIGEGTVMWQQDGNIQRLLVVQGEDTEWINELACIVLPDSTLAISYLADEHIIYWRNAQMDHEVALSFTNGAGCAQVWEDVQLLQSSPEALDFGDGSHLDAADMDTFMGGMVNNFGREPVELPEPSAENLPEVIKLLGNLNCRPQLLSALSLEDAASDRRDDFVGKLCELFDPLDQQAQQRGAGTPSVELGVGARSVGGWTADEGSADEDAEIEARATLELLAQCFKALLALGGFDPRLLQRLLRRDTVSYMFGALEYETPHGTLQTASVNRSHREYVLSARRFKMPVPILDATTLEAIHQNCAPLAAARAPASSREDGARVLRATARSVPARAAVSPVSPREAFNRLPPPPSPRLQF